MTHSSHNFRDTTWLAFLTITLFAAAMLLPDMALAADGTSPIGFVVCKILGWLTGATGRAIATLAIIIIGVGALMGKVSWGMAIIVAVGVAIVFGAPEILKLLGGGASTCAEAQPVINSGG